MFWKTLNRPILALAPMADVTDAAFRRLIAQYGKPDVIWTEFVSADGLFHTREKKGMADAENPLMQDLLYTEAERPIVAQLFGSNPSTMEYAAALAKQLGFDGIDINMGCPDRSIERQGAGAAHMKDPARAREVIRAAQRGAEGLPVSVKTRIGYHRETLDTWLPEVLAEAPAALTVHLRTRKELSLVPAHWELMGRVKALRDLHSPDTVLLGNGDVPDRKTALARAEEHGIDGVMLGRAIFGNPWRFSKEVAVETLAPSSRLRVLSEHVGLYAELLPQKSFAIMRKHFKAYVSGWPGAAELRAALMEAPDAPAVRALLDAAADATV